MDELKKQTMDTFAKNTKEWTDAIKTARDTKSGIDLTVIIENLAKNMATLDEKFNEARIRLEEKTKKKGGLW